MSNIVRIGGATLNQTPIDWENNFQNILYAIEYARINEVKILCLPELCITGYGCEDLFLANWVAEEALNQLIRLLPYTYDIAVCVGLPISMYGNLYNCVCMIQNGKILGLAAKQFLANDGIHYEKRWFKAWPKKIIDLIEIDGMTYPIGETTFKVEGISLGFEICEDAWQDNGRPGWRHKSSKVNLIMNPSASHFAFGKSQIRKDLVVSSSSKFDCAYVYANLLGNEAGRAIYDGEILIAQKGRFLNRNKLLSYQSFNLLYSDIDFTNHFNSTLNDTNQVPDCKEIEFRDAITLGLFDYLRKSKSKGFVLSLSGGADSSTCAVLVHQMIKNGSKELGLKYFSERLLGSFDEFKISNIQDLSKSILTCAYQSTENSSDNTILSAKQLAIEIAADFHSWSIDEEVNSYSGKIENTLGRKLDWKTDDIAMQNIQARSRSPIIWMLTNIKNALLITTSNRSEGSVGYATMDGDTSGSISPIAGVDKFFIRQWLIWAEKELGYNSLKFVNKLKPSAELRPLDLTQTDEKDLMPYDILNKIEIEAIKNRKNPTQVFEILLSDIDIDPKILKLYIQKFFTMWSRNQWKRERLAPSFHLDEHSVDSRTWCRFPILSGGFGKELSKL